MLDSSPTQTTPFRIKSRASTIRVLTVPPRHPYISAIKPDTVKPIHIDRTIGWEPDPIFEAGAITKLDDVDIVHVQFSFDHLEVTQARCWLAELETKRLPLVLTVHDLRNPHHATRHQHDALLAELIPAASAVITLTEGAAREIHQRFGVQAHVVPHPTLVDPTRSDAVITETGLATLHLKSLRRNVVNPLALVEAAAAGAADAGGRLQVNIHREVRDRELLTALQKMEGISLNIHHYYSDIELEHYIRRAHVTVLPHHWGTHSGWLELARDLGTRVVSPDCGYYGDQWSEVVHYTNNETTGLDPISLSNAVAYALSQPPPAAADRTQRRAEVTAVRRSHELLYRRLVR